MSVRRLSIVALCLLVTAPARAQTAPTTTATAGRNGSSSAGEIGVRQTRDAATSTNPMLRLETRIQNRVENRIRNRIDRDYDPLANATAPFAGAAVRSRASAQRRR